MLSDGLDLSSRKAVVVAVSGGSDSLALLFLLKRHLAMTGAAARPIVVTVDHRLRPEAADEARQVGEIAVTLGIEHRIFAWDDAKPATGISAAARAARHGLLAQAALEAGTDLVLTGHTMDDQAETVAMRQQRGGGLGEAGMAPATLFDGQCWFARPLLGARRTALRDFLNGIGCAWIDDPSNDDRRYERVRLRKSLDDAEVRSLAQQADEAGAAREALGARAAGLMDSCASMAGSGLVRLAADVPAADRDGAVYALRILLAAIGGCDHLPDATRSAAVLDGLASGDGRATLARCLVERRGNDIRIRRERRGAGSEAPPFPTLGPWERYLPSFDLMPASALARLIGRAELPRPPFTRHNLPKA